MNRGLSHTPKSWQKCQISQHQGTKQGASSIGHLRVVDGGGEQGKGKGEVRGEGRGSNSVLGDAKQSLINYCLIFGIVTIEFRVRTKSCN